MTAAVAIKRVDLLVCLIERADARAYLWWAGLIDTIPAALDPLQKFAEQAGIDADLAQQILADAFAPFREAAP